MRTIAVIFILALITIAGEIYSDAVLRNGEVLPGIPDAAAVAVGHATQAGIDSSAKGAREDGDR